MASFNILVIHPDTIVDTSSYRELLVAKLENPYLEIDGSSRGDSNAVKEAILSGKYSTILVCDLSDNPKWFTDKFRLPLQTFVKAGGVVAFPTSEGGHLCWFVLRPIFGVEWERGDYRRRDLVKCQSMAANRWCPNGPSVVNVKGESLKNVSESEKLYSIRGSSEVAFAVAKYGDGYVAYFSDVNTETGTVAIVAEFLSRARRRRITLGRLNELVSPEKALKVWADGSCLDNHQTGKPRIGGMGFAFDKKSGFGSYYGPVEDNFHPVLTTNNSAELQAAVNALIVAKKRDRSIVLMHVDSTYVRDCVTDWMPMWKNRGWLKADGQPPANLKWLKKLYELEESMSIEWKWIPRRENRRADALAGWGSKLYLSDTDGGLRVAEDVRATLAHHERRNGRRFHLVNARRVILSGTKRIQVKFDLPFDDGGPKTVYCVPSLKAFGLIKINPLIVEDDGVRRFRIPVSSKIWDKMEFEGADIPHLLLPPGAIVGVGLTDHDPRGHSQLAFEAVEYLSKEDRLGPNPNENGRDDDDLAVDDTEDDDHDDHDEEGETTVFGPGDEAQMAEHFHRLGLFGY